MANSVLFGQHLTALREDRKWSQSELARRAKLNPSYISQMEAGDRLPGFNTLCALRTAFGLTADEVIGPGCDPEPGDTQAAA